MNAPQPKYDVFLSHSDADAAAVALIARRLRDEVGLQPWLDEWHMIPGTPRMETWEGALSRSQTCAVFIGSAGLSGWHREKMGVALEARVRDLDFHVIPVLLPGADLPERGGLPSFLARYEWVDFRPGLDDPRAFHRLVCGIKGIAPIEGELPAAEAICPYRGLRPFQEEHAHFFFGRGALTQWLVDDVRRGNFVAIIGPSGSGKSSLAQAGLITALRGGALPGSKRWPLRILTPGEEPIVALSSGLLPLLAPTDPVATRRNLTEGLRADPREFARVVGQILAEKALVEGRLLLLIDQFEEIFTLCHDEAERATFIAALLDATRPDRQGLIVVLTMRADFYGRAAAYAGLAARLESRQRLVSPLDGVELRQAVEEPARLVGLNFEKGMVDTILDDAGHEPGVLPLVQHTLWELWQRRQGEWLTFDAYRAIGGVKGALAHRAEKVYAGFTPQEQDVTRRMLLRLTQPGEGTEDTRRRAGKAELIPDPAQAERVERVMQKLADARLLITGKGERGGEIVDVAHEALIRGWPRLQKWIDGNRVALRVHRRLTEAANEWDKHGRDESYLYRGARLAEVEKLVPVSDLSALERAFVQASAEARRAERRARRQRLLSRMAVIGLTLLLLISAGVIIRQIQRSRPLWQPVTGFPDDAVVTLAVADGLSPTYYAGTANIGVVRSQDGVTWTVHRQGLPTAGPLGGDARKNVRGVARLAIDVLDPRYVFASVLRNSVYKSTDGGTTWQAANAGLPDGNVTALVARDGLVLAAFGSSADYGLHVSLDGGTSWEPVRGQGQVQPQIVRAVCIASDQVYVGAEDGLYSSPVGPPWVWERVAALPSVRIIEPQNRDSLYLATYNTRQGEGSIYHWRPGEEMQLLATFEGPPVALAPHPDPAASVATYVLLVDGQVLAVTNEGQTSLGKVSGLVYGLLAVSHPTREGVWLLLGHGDGLLEYRGTLD